MHTKTGKINIIFVCMRTRPERKFVSRRNKKKALSLTHWAHKVNSRCLKADDNNIFFMLNVPLKVYNMAITI